uniref:NADH-ubiquinone oxidoreductase chain 2 n=1 Tax=Allocarsidara bakeri TaxID=2218082 RepID=A0A344A227_9HEMI|nr:NADH dehydrogenase subunit 2 [Allocarsidara bakeri]AWU48818.1 NADH dehydrogenase subunit 2 [Allocarsidara bakeri]
MKNQKWIYPMYVYSLIFPLSSTSWMNMWIGLEINLMMFIMILNKNKSPFLNESMMKYFLIQASGSLIFLITLNLNTIYFNEWPNINALIPPLALMMKMGLAPIHMWVPEVAKNFSFMSLFVFLTLQKINPLLILFSSWFKLIFYMAMINIIMGSMMAINENSMNKLLIFSSIANSGWMLNSLMISNYLFLLIFSTYTFLMYNMIHMNKYLKIKWMSQLKSMNLYKKMSIYMMFMSLSGLPPLLGFAPKWMLIKNMINYMPIYTWMLITFSTVSTFFYIKTSMLMMMPAQEKKKWMFFNMKNFNYILITFINMMGICLFSIII